MKNLENLNQISAFKSSPELVKQLYQFGIERQFKAGSIILKENNYIRSIPIVISGSLKVIRTEEDGREILLYYIRPGESCIMSFLGGLHDETSKVKAEAEETTTVLLIPIEKVPMFIKDYPQWLDYIFKLYHQRFEDLLEIINAIAFKKVDERLLQLLHKMAENTQSNILFVTHEQLANDLGTARVVVSRLLKKLEEDKEVILGRNKITLKNKVL